MCETNQDDSLSIGARHTLSLQKWPGMLPLNQDVTFLSCETEFGTHSLIKKWPGKSAPEPRRQTLKQSSAHTLSLEVARDVRP